MFSGLVSFILVPFSGLRVCEYAVCITSGSYPRETPCSHAFWGVSWFGSDSSFTGLGFVVWWFVSSCGLLRHILSVSVGTALVWHRVGVMLGSAMGL
jgi:hypothetical protein